MKSFSTFDGAIFAALCEACNFFGTTAFPENFVFPFEKGSIFFKFSCFCIEYCIDFH